MERLTRKWVENTLTEQAPGDSAYVDAAMMQIDLWLDRGDGCAVYRNEDLQDHVFLGHCKFVSYGSPKAQLEVEEPPQTLPDIGTDINWRYQLVGVYRADKSAEIIDIVRQHFGEDPAVD